MLAVRDSEMAAVSVGISLVRTKVIAFMLSAFFASIAGWLYAYIVGFIAPSAFTLFPSVYFLVAVILGGSGSVLGAWLGQPISSLSPRRSPVMGQPNLFPIFGGAVMVLVAMLLPGGFVDGGKRLAAWWRSGGRNLCSRPPPWLRPPTLARRPMPEMLAGRGADRPVWGARRRPGCLARVRGRRRHWPDRAERGWQDDAAQRGLRLYARDHGNGEDRRGRRDRRGARPAAGPPGDRSQLPDRPATRGGDGFHERRAGLARGIGSRAPSNSSSTCRASAACTDGTGWPLRTSQASSG